MRHIDVLRVDFKEFSGHRRRSFARIKPIDKFHEYATTDTDSYKKDLKGLTIYKFSTTVGNKVGFDNLLYLLV